MDEMRNTAEETAMLEHSNQILDLFENIQDIHTENVVSNLVPGEFPRGGELRNNEMCFYRINQLSFDEDYPHREAFENVLLALDNDAFNFVYLLTGAEEGIEICLGVVKNENENVPVLGKKLSANNYGEIIENVFEGNFNGSKLEKLTGKQLKETVITSTEKYKNAGVILGIPSINEKVAGDEYDFQGVDRLINSMMGLEWRLAVVCEPVSKQKIQKLRNDIYELYNRLYVCSKISLQGSANDGKTVSLGKNTSDSRSKNWGMNSSDTRGRGSQSETKNSSTSHQTGTSTGASETYSNGKSSSVSMNRGTSHSVTIEIANKHAQEILKYIDEELLERLKVGFSRGLFKTSVYYMAKEPSHANRLKVGIMSLFQGNQSSFSPLTAQKIDLENEINQNILKIYQNQQVNDELFSGDALMLMGRPYYGMNIGLSTYLTTEEISLFAGLPQKEVPGLSLKEGASFGLNERNVDKDSAINLGYMVQKGRILKKIPFYLSKNSMAKHTFIAGVTGSGKTTTCHRLLTEAEMPFLVIEPAKTEYRTLITSELFDNNTGEGITVFTLGNETVAPFRINPFELIEGEVISAHVDMLKATFTSAFPMEASMPQILEEAIYKCYEDKGWNIDTNENEKYGDEAFSGECDCFPIMSELLEALKEVVASKNFGPELKSNYEGSLISRLSNLTVGSKGSMLNCPHSIDFTCLVKRNVILEMEELKSPEDKALFIGFVLSRLSAVIKNEHKKNPEFKHLTLVEEAHRLLSKVEYGDSGSKKGAVETFTDLLAEVRKYGEGLIVVDQIPNKLASEVLKNTNTKIIHKILAKDDKEAVGDTMLMDDKQKQYLSALSVGEAIIFTENTDKPVQVQITPVSDTSEAEIEDQTVRKRFLENRTQFGTVYEDLEIMQDYRAFIDFMKCLKTALQKDAKAELAEATDFAPVQKIKKCILKAAKRYEEDEYTIWKKMFYRFCKESGRMAANLECAEEQVEQMAEFFANRFYAENMDIRDSPYSIQMLLI